MCKLFFSKNEKGVFNIKLLKLIYLVDFDPYNNSRSQKLRKPCKGRFFTCRSTSQRQFLGKIALKFYN